MFEERVSIAGRLEHRISKGSTTVEFLDGNIDGNDLTDTVYITANPQLHRFRDQLSSRFFSVVDVWKEDGWDEEHDTVLPETVVKYTLEALKKYKNKRLLVHFIQPHYPFLGSGGDFDKNHLSKGDSSGKNIWNKKMEGDLDISREELWELYIDNLQRTVPHVQQLINNLNGKTVVTADHGNMVGERAWPVPIREWGHPRGIYTEQLVKVPWLIHEKGGRRSIVAEQPTEENLGSVSSEVNQRLRDLGYKAE